MEKSALKFTELLNVMEQLRGPNGCPWDREQTHESLRQYLLEETYEVLETIDEGRLEDLPEELGDLILQAVFHAQIAKEEGRFDITDILAIINEKLIRRHPHVFGDKKLDSSDEVKEQWHNIKMKENVQNGKSPSLTQVTHHLPALMRAYRISERAARAGLDWEDISGVLDKTEEEWSEFKTALLSL